MTTSNLVLEQQGLGMAFIRLQPGVPPAFEDVRLPEGLSVYKCLGYWDMFGMAPVDSIEDARQVRQQLVDGAEATGKVLRSHCEALYGWADASMHGLESLTTGGTWADYPLLTITFCKVDPALLADRSAGGVAALSRCLNSMARAWRRLQLSPSDVKVAVYGALSWTDFVLFTFSQDFAQAIDTVRSLTSLPIPPLQQGSPLTHRRGAMFSKTVTVPAVNWGWLSGAVCGEDAGRDLLSAAGTAPGLTATLSLSVRTGSIEQAAALVQARLSDCLIEGTGAPRLVLGRDDLEFTLQKLTPSGLRGLLDLRKALQGDLYISHTHVSGELSAEHAAMATYEGERAKKDKGMHPRPVMISRSQVDNVAVEDESVARQVEELIETVNLLYADPLTRDMYQDIAPCFAKFARKLNEGAYGDPTDVETLADDCDQLAEAIRQRSLAARIVFSGERQTASSDAGVYMKLATAAGGVPASVLRTAGYAWPGAIIVDRHPDYNRLTSHLISVRHKDLYHPSKWWGLTHEAGHEFAAWQVARMEPPAQHELLECVRQCVHDAKDGAPMTGYADGDDSDDVYAATDLYLELCAEVFDLVRGFKGDWDHYIGVTWPHLQHARYVDALEEHLFRAFVAFTVSLLKGATAPADPPADLQEMAASFLGTMKLLSQGGTRDLVSLPYVGAWLVSMTSAWWPGIQRAMEMMEVGPYHGSAERGSPDQRSVVSEWLGRRVPEGSRVVAHRSITEFARSLEDGKASFGAEIAAILTLWAQRQKQLGPAKHLRFEISR